MHLSIVCLRGVKFVRPFSNSIVALAVVYEVRTMVEQEVKGIHETVLRDGEVLLELLSHEVCCVDAHSIGQIRQHGPHL